MIRKIIKIDQELCNGCGLCIDACHEDAIALIDGKATLIRDDYCDGLGNCLPVCPANALSFEEREALEYNEEEVNKNIAAKNKAKGPVPIHTGGGCPGMASKTIVRKEAKAPALETSTPSPVTSMLNQWPVQIQLVPVNAPYFKDAHLLIAADCTAYAYADFHNKFMKNRITIIGCPKLDDTDYSEKLTEILKQNSIKSVTVLRMVVPCCGGLSGAAVTALKNCDKMIPWQVVTISLDGTIIEE